MHILTNHDYLTKINLFKHVISFLFFECCCKSVGLSQPVELLNWARSLAIKSRWRQLSLVSIDNCHNYYHQKRWIPTVELKKQKLQDNLLGNVIYFLVKALIHHCITCKKLCRISQTQKIVELLQIKTELIAILHILTQIL